MEAVSEAKSESDELRLEMDRIDSALEALRSAHQMLGDGWPTMPQWRIATRYKGATGGRNLPSGPRGLASAEDVAAERFDSYQEYLARISRKRAGWGA